VAQLRGTSSKGLAVKVALDVSAVPVKIAGAGRYIVEIGSRLASRVELTAVTRHDDDRWPELIPGANLSPIVPSSRPLRLLSEAFLLGRSKTSQRCDVWHSPHYTMPRTGTVKHAVTIHDLTFFTNPEWHEPAKVSFFRRVISYAAQHADVLIAVSKKTADDLEEILSPRGQIVIAPHGVDLSRFTPNDADDVRRLATLGIDGSYLAFVGTLEPRKGVDVVLNAFAEIAPSNTELKLVLAGQRGWALEEIDELIAGHPFRDRIVTPGFLPDSLLPALLRTAQVVVYPSRGEGFGLPVLEALACGAPVVTTSGTVMEEVAGNSAQLVGIGDVTGTADAIHRLLSMTANQRREISLLARERASEFTWENSVAKHIEAYRAAVNS
jgi:glycosyltransferase involved in cell wall biosynthesis